EIEAVLAQHPFIREAVVVAKEMASGDKQLVAYVVAKATPTAAELRKYLAEKLPSYAVPSIYVPLNSLPLTPNGKVDRRALPEPTTEGIYSADYNPPQT